MRDRTRDKYDELMAAMDEGLAEMRKMPETDEMLAAIDGLEQLKASVIALEKVRASMAGRKPSDAPSGGWGDLLRPQP